ncbi:MAG TPA: DUF4367 domain-containing protein [Bacillota bacterium]|nr:DUF4367 domain-containing protein [Bacillota bacterium]
MKNNCDEQSRRALYEGRLFHEAMKRVAILEGEKLIMENQELNESDPEVSVQKQSEFKSRLDQAMRKRKKSRGRLSRMKPCQKVAVAILIIGAAVSISLFTTDALRVRVLNLFMDVKPEYTEFRLEEDQGQEKARNVDWKDAYAPTYVPEGYYVDSAENHDSMKSIIYANKDGDFIDYGQYSENSSVNYDTEDASMEDIAVNGEAGTLIVKGDRYSIIWQHDRSIFVIMTHISEEETLKIAESIKFLK